METEVLSNLIRRCRAVFHINRGTEKRYNQTRSDSFTAYT